MVRSPEWKPSFDDPEIQAYLFDVAGEEGLEIFRFILENEPTSGEAIQEAFPDRKPSAVRKVLYALMQEHALEYHKDTDTKGWETFTWATDLPEIRLIHTRRWQDEARELRKELRFERDHTFYSCPDRHLRIYFEAAMDTEFHCPECEAPMDPIDNADVIQRIEARLDELAPALQV